jgi:KGK domain
LSFGAKASARKIYKNLILLVLNLEAFRVENHQLMKLGEVISISTAQHINITNETCTVEEFMRGLSSVVELYIQRHTNYGSTGGRGQWFTEEGVEGQVLRFGQNEWESGTLRLRIEFCPDEPEPEPEAPELPLLEASIEPADSPLDEIRRLAEE